MKTISKFIINRDDTKFLYVEKCRVSKKDDRMKYFVHSSPRDVAVYSDHTFHSVHSIDEKMSVLNFAKNASETLFTELYNDKNRYCYNVFKDVYSKTSGDKNIHNPNLKGIKNNLLEGLKVYNEVMFTLEDFNLPEENYSILDEQFYVRQKVKSISSLISEEERENEEEVLNIPVKELVRKKVA